MPDYLLMTADQKRMSKIFAKPCFGFEPKSIWQDFTCQRRLKKAAKEKGVIPG